MCFHFFKNFEIHQYFYDSFIINLTILLIYIEFLLLFKKGFTLSIITSFKKKKKLSYIQLSKNYSDGKGSKWILLNRLNGLKKLKIVRLTKKITLNRFGYFLAIILIFSRKIFSIKDFG